MLDEGRYPGIPYYRVPLFNIEDIFDPYRMLNAYIEHGHNIGYHAHSFYEINIVVSGCGVHYLGRERIEVSRGDVFIIPPYHLHAYEGPHDFDVYHVIFRPSFFSKHLLSFQHLPSFHSLFELEPILRNRGGTAKHFILRGEAFDKIIGGLDIVSRSMQVSESTTLVAECHAIIAVSNLCEEYTKLQQSDSQSDGDAPFMRSISEIYEHYRENLTVDELCRIANLSRSAYIKKFRESLGCTPRQFILRERVKAAKSLLIGSNMSVTEIAETLGFYDSSHFYKAFSTEVGCTPVEFRKNPQ